MCLRVRLQHQISPYDQNKPTNVQYLYKSKKKRFVHLHVIGHGQIMYESLTINIHVHTSRFRLIIFHRVIVATIKRTHIIMGDVNQMDEAFVGMSMLLIELVADEVLSRKLLRELLRN